MPPTSPIVPCAIFVVWDGERVLMENRPEYVPGASEHWVFPGGKLKDDELPIFAMRREFKEELAGCEPTHYYRLNGEPLVGGNGYPVYAYLVTEWIGSIGDASADDNHAELRWKPLSDAILGPDSPTVVKEVARLAAAMVVAVERDLVVPKRQAYRDLDELLGSASITFSRSRGIPRVPQE